MKQILYSEEDYKIFQYLLRETPQQIIENDSSTLIFDYGKRYVRAAPKDFLPNSQNDHDEAIGVRCTKISGYYQFHERDNVLFSSYPIQKIWVVRTVLYFSDHITFSSKDEAIGNALPELSEPETETEGKLAKFFSELTGAHEEIICHPLSEEAENVNHEFANLVDAGFILQVDGKMLAAFSPNNAFSLSGKILTSRELDAEIKPYYQLIEVTIRDMLQ